MSTDQITDQIIGLILDYGEAATQHGREQARYVRARGRSATADDTALRAAGLRALAAYAALHEAVTGIDGR